MKFTVRQRMLLDNLHFVKVQSTARGFKRFFLAHDDVTGTVNSLIVRGVLIKDARGTRLLATALAETGRA